ncbi:nap family protein [Sporothrix brasiliensis 5110]|uniref:Nap family protein n=1 Tax=Sporothrix brasiliensis 5110 TaxID=1398154 RepID=A0A0C2J4Z4_9PEZI|nr:nap family protein [Sporothrix brasiliensis 5110]KIH94090.1 nap family protein [Sporothrix brasiliensis 5110]
MAPTEPPAQVSSVTYSELSDIEADFDDFNVELLIQQAARERTLYERRAEIVRRIAGFWPLVFEQAPPEIDQCVQPSDAAVILSALEEIEVVRFEIGSRGDGQDGQSGDPRSVAIRFTFGENDLFEDRVLEKRFWHRRAPAKVGADGKPSGKDAASESWAGLVSEPVAIKWKEGRDPTNGLLDLAVQVWKEGASSSSSSSSAAATSASSKARDELSAQLSKTAIGGLSFFAWFGYVGRRISAEESAAAVAQEREQRAERKAKRAKGEKVGDEDEEKEDDEKNDEKDDKDDEEYEYEIFPDGDTVALALAEDLWPNAIKYFRQAQEQETLSDADFEEDYDDIAEDDDEEDEEEVPPAKKQRT